MASFLLRFWLKPSGTLSRRHYRIFLAIYFLFLFPLFTAVTMSFLVLGYRRENGILHENAQANLWIISTLYTVMIIWPLAVASIKRMHDLGLRGPFRFFRFNPIQGVKTFHRMLNERGPSPEED